MRDCLFCRIVRGELPAAIVRQDERTIAFMDVAPGTRGHCLVIPREHAADLTAISTADLAACAVATQDLARRALARLGAEGVTIANACGGAAGQTVFHFHVHVLPRYADDGVRLPWQPGAAPADEIEAAAALLRS